MKKHPTLAWDLMVYARLTKAFLRRDVIAALALSLVLQTVGCGSRGVPVALDNEVVPSEDKTGRAAGKVGGRKKKKGRGSGPKIMGYDHWLRLSYSVLQGTYSDEQENETTERKNEQKNIPVNGSRFTLEHYPHMGLFSSQYGYTYMEFRDEKPEPSYWSKRQTYIGTMGWVLNKARLIAPVVGIHWEFNEIDLGQDESPEVAKSDIRALIAGVQWRQHIWGTGTWFALYHKGKLHLLNPGFESWGYEGEFGLGNSFKWGPFQCGLEVGYIKQSYKGDTQADKEDTRKLKVLSSSSSAYGMFTLWL